jgi:WD40 repeat protein
VGLQSQRIPDTRIRREPPYKEVAPCPRPARSSDPPSSHTFSWQTTVLIATEPVAPSKPPVDSEVGTLPPGALARLGSLGLRHEGDVGSVCFSPDGKKIASVPQHDSTIRIWDSATGKLLHAFDAPGIFSREFHTPDDFTLAFTPDGTSIAAGVGSDVCFWDCQTGREVRRFRGKSKGILALTFSPDRKTFFCGGADNSHSPR